MSIQEDESKKQILAQKMSFKEENWVKEKTKLQNLVSYSCEKNLIEFAN